MQGLQVKMLLPDTFQNVFNTLMITPSYETNPERVDKHGQPEQIWWLKSNTVSF